MSNDYLKEAVTDLFTAVYEQAYRDLVTMVADTDTIGNILKSDHWQSPQGICELFTSGEFISAEFGARLIDQAVAEGKSKRISRARKYLQGVTINHHYIKRAILDLLLLEQEISHAEDEANNES